MNNNIEQIYQEISQVDEELARIFREFDEISFDSFGMNRASADDFGSNIPTKTIKDKYNDLFNKLAGHIGDINIIPGGIVGECHPICLCNALDKWQSKNGFKGIAERVIALWISCFNINRKTLVFTFAWDELDFIEKFKEKFDNYASQGRTICIILVTLNGMSLQYLK